MYLNICFASFLKIKPKAITLDHISSLCFLFHFETRVSLNCSD